MSDTWITDLRHFLDDDGDLAASPSRPFAQHVCRVVEAVTADACGELPNTGVRCRRRPARKPCPGFIQAGLLADVETIRWACPECGDNGYVTGWEGTQWNRFTTEERTELEARDLGISDEDLAYPLGPDPEDREKDLRDSEGGESVGRDKSDSGSDPVAQSRPHLRVVGGRDVRPEEPLLAPKIPPDYTPPGLWTVNRCAAVVRARQPFVRWAAQLDDERPLFGHDNRDNASVYLIPLEQGEEQDGVPIELWFGDVFGRELEGRCRDESLWPRNRDLSTFLEWFDVETQSIVVDLDDSPLKRRYW